MSAASLIHDTTVSYVCTGLAQASIAVAVLVSHQYIIKTNMPNICPTHKMETELQTQTNHTNTIHACGKLSSFGSLFTTSLTTKAGAISNLTWKKYSTNTQEKNIIFIKSSQQSLQLVQGQLSDLALFWNHTDNIMKPRYLQVSIHPPLKGPSPPARTLLIFHWYYDTGFYPKVCHVWTFCRVKGIHDTVFLEHAVK